MTLYEQWISTAYTRDGRANDRLWDDYLPREQKIYEYILENKVTALEGTIKELAERFDMSVQYMAGFVDGVNDTQTEPIDLKTLTEDTSVSLTIDFATLYKQMVEYKADHLYTLPQWSNVFTEDELKSLYKEQKKSKTIVNKDAKIGRNDPCPCGSGKKYKKCCGAN